MSGLSNYQKFIMEASFKNAVLGKANTNANISWYEEYDKITKRVDIYSLWIDSDKIPEEAPDLKDGEYYTVTVGNVEINILQKFDSITLTKVTGTKASFYNEKLKNAIEPTYGTGYSFSLRDNNNDSIPFGLNKWVVDPESGLLTFIDGVPNGYDTSALYITAYRYVGRRGTDGIVTTDGTSQMADGYSPEEEQSIATKAYVDSKVTDVNDAVAKLIPDTPDTFEGKDLVIESDWRWGRNAKTTDPAIPIIYKENNYVLVLRVPTYYNLENKGSVRVLVNDNIIYTQRTVDMQVGQDEIFKVEKISDPYEKNIVSDDFYSCIDMTVNLPLWSTILPHIPNPDSMVFTVRLEFTIQDKVQFTSNSITIGIDYESISGTIRYIGLENAKIASKYISGVPAMVKGDTFNFVSRISTINMYRKDTYSRIVLNKILDKEIPTSTIYSDYYPICEYTESVEIPSGVYAEKFYGTVYSYNLDGQNAEKTFSYPIRVDSVSDESERVVSPSTDWDSFGNDWSESYQQTSLRYLMELQMLNGQYQWPRGDYSDNGKGLSFTSVWRAGPIYSDLETGTRFVTFKYTLKDANGFYLSFRNMEGIDYDKYTHLPLGLTYLKCRVMGTDKTDWLDILTPYDGVLCPNDTYSKGCFVVNRSSTNKSYITFGSNTLSGVLYVTVAINYNLNIKFSGIDIEFN